MIKLKPAKELWDSRSVSWVAVGYVQLPPGEFPPAESRKFHAKPIVLVKAKNPEFFTSLGAVSGCASPQSGFIYQQVQGKPWGTAAIALNGDLNTGTSVWHRSTSDSGWFALPMYSYLCLLLKLTLTPLLNPNQNTAWLRCSYTWLFLPE